MSPDLFRKFDEWFKQQQGRGLFIAVLTGQAPEQLAGWHWTELKAENDGSVNIMELYRNLRQTASLFKGTTRMNLAATVPPSP
jgi:hypothetical protein